MRRTSRMGLSLVEVVVAGAILVVVVLSIGAMLAQSARGTKEAGPRLLAQHAATRVAERLRSLPYAAGYDAFWGVAPVVTISGTAWAAVDIGTPSNYTGTPWEDCVAPLVDAMSGPRRRMTPPSDAPLRPLRVRFCTEQEYQQLWGVPPGPASDLDFDGTLDTLGLARASYSVHPVLIEVRWRALGTGTGANVMVDDFYQLRTVQMAEPKLDPERGT